MGHPYWISVVFFLLAGAPGFWMPALSNVLRGHELAGYVELAFMIPGIAALISPLIFAAQVDQRLQAQKVLGVILIAGSVFLYYAFVAVEEGWGGSWFLLLMSINALISAPSWSLLTMITLSNTPESGKSFGLYRVWGTLGWMVAGFLVSWWALDHSPTTGKIAAGVRLVAGTICFLLPATLPQGGPAKSLREALGLGALVMFKDRDQLIYFITAFLFSIPLAAFYLHTPVHLKDLGVQRISATMATAQVVEAVAMLLLGFVLRKYRIKTILVVAIVSGILRYAFCAVDVYAWLLIGILLHGVCWTFFFEAGRIFVNRRVDPAIRGQAQALLGIATGGLAGLLGVVAAKFLFSWCVESGAGGWSAYWAVLAGFSFLSLVIFTVGYRGSDR